MNSCFIDITLTKKPNWTHQSGTILEANFYKCPYLKVAVTVATQQLCDYANSKTGKVFNGTYCYAKIHRILMYVCMDSGNCQLKHKMQDYPHC